MLCYGLGLRFNFNPGQLLDSVLALFGGTLTLLGDTLALFGGTLALFGDDQQSSSKGLVISIGHRHRASKSAAKAL